MKKHFSDKGLREPKLYTDMRKLFEDKSIDAVSVVTPNHWHALAGIRAIQAGKYASIEKPSCHTINEGKMLVEAAKKYNRVVQDGAEQRSNPSAQSAVQYMRDGKLGEVYLAKGICYKWRDSIGKYPDGLMTENSYQSKRSGRPHDVRRRQANANYFNGNFRVSKSSIINRVEPVILINNRSGHNFPNLKTFFIIRIN